jgi:molybdopterin-containing oxidoreductase family iron-sulfur binding subunit
MVLNPDVNVRSRGVMEKCSMCIQMTQATILNAKKREEKWLMENSKLHVQNVLMEQWWDVNDKGSEIKKLDDERMYHLLCWNKTKCDLSR